MKFTMNTNPTFQYAYAISPESLLTSPKASKETQSIKNTKKVQGRD